MAAGRGALLPAGDEVGVGGRDRGGAWRDLEGEEREREEEERGEISVWGGGKGGGRRGCPPRVDAATVQGRERFAGCNCNCSCCPRRCSFVFFSFFSFFDWNRAVCKRVHPRN